jgi:hypothetical protein
VHDPPEHAPDPATVFGRAEQSLPHPAHVCTSEGDAQSPAEPHVSRGLGHAHAPHWQASVQVCRPPVAPQACTDPGWQVPWPLQAIHVDQAPLLQLRDCVPQ